MRAARLRTLLRGSGAGALAMGALTMGALAMGALGCGGGTDGDGSTSGGGGASSSGSTSPPAENRAPVIDRIEAPVSVTESGGRYVVQVRVVYHDDDGDTVTQVRLQFPEGNFDTKTAIQQATPANRAATVSLELVASTAPAGTYEYLVSVFDEHGLESEISRANITLE
jgi:hypothetical protein